VWKILELIVNRSVWAGDAPRYPAAKTLVVSFPGVDVGSIISYTLVKEIKYQPFFQI
jgi:hypothetical protein